MVSWAASMLTIIVAGQIQIQEIQEGLFLVSGITLGLG